LILFAISFLFFLLRWLTSMMSMTFLVLKYEWQEKPVIGEIWVFLGANEKLQMICYGKPIYWKKVLKNENSITTWSCLAHGTVRNLQPVQTSCFWLVRRRSEKVPVILTLQRKMHLKSWVYENMSAKAIWVGKTIIAKSKIWLMSIFNIHLFLVNFSDRKIFAKPN